jgi:hypothetical protein
MRALFNGFKKFSEKNVGNGCLTAAVAKNSARSSHQNRREGVVAPI